ncbi:MAG: RagB/SusD family nutrient uptake outer membrane protein [Bacteroidales bacterium]|nr:RagB/SusD family nutrient uptake outer membrane protein [Bacteroidales bacterium]MCF8344029.1 RagB/SusD family nutrient uptake outer membrane protein [Bacteroidales bacterium]MCF8350043.1 RagB/SusD family nutrient uptake outer membrane protein [Bacteroidales bacterium]MCF8375199.1 RagB/SusD family nutrient uptake outer membrane protein [Bacteroidales bacterium]MCF8400679.1 RagB/SusD family nutrient uptake outer membrane protein [Bacteroidales bacterium]
MKREQLYPILFLLIAVFLSACEKEFLDRKPLDQEVSTNFYQTEEDAMMALVAVYDVLGYQSSPGVSWAPFVTMSDILSDDSYAGGADANDGMDENELNTFDIPTTNKIIHAIWIKNYIGIFRANLLLEKIEDIDASREFKDRIIAECKFLRAYFYVEQVRFFENIPLLTETIKGPSGYDQEQNTPKEVYDQIASDLVDAIDALPEVIPPAEAGRISKWAAEALLARVYLFYNGIYASELNAGETVVDRAVALQYLEDLIQNSGHDLFEDYRMNFKLAGEFGVESVFEISYGDTPQWWDWDYVVGGEGNLAAQMQGPRVTGSEKWNRGWSFGIVGQKLVDDLEGDPRLYHTVLFQDSLDGVLTEGYQHTGYFSNKYTSDAEHWGAGGQFELNRTCNHRVIRFSDVLLMAAELGSPNAQQYLDRVRDRVGLESVPATMENILRERRLELSLEGIRYFDLLRQGMAVASEELTVIGVRGPKYIGDQVIFDVTFDQATKGFLPIPQTEIDLSGGLFRQNEGY